MPRTVIAIDVDDVLAHSIESFRIAVNNLTGASLEPEHFTVPGDYHHYLDRVLEMNGVDYEPIKDTMFETMVRDQSHIHPSEGAANVLKDLSGQYDLIVITARPPEWQDATLAWMAVHFPDTFKDIHFAGNRHDPAKKTKGDMCLEAGAKYLIDDNPEHCASALDKGVTAVLYGDFGWHANSPDGIVRCRTWQDIKEFFDAERHRS